MLASAVWQRCFRFQSSRCQPRTDRAALLSCLVCAETYLLPRSGTSFLFETLWWELLDEEKYIEGPGFDVVVSEISGNCIT